MQATRCAGCERDLAFLSRRRRPAYEVGDPAVRVVDLFCGAGGLTLGIAEAARRQGAAVDIRLAVDSNQYAIDTYHANFPRAVAVKADVESLFPGGHGSTPLKGEVGVAQETGPVHVLLGGPPCQGMSSLNNKTRLHDDRNDLYGRMGRAAEVLRPYAVLIENVPAARRDQANVVERTVRSLQDQGYSTSVEVAEMATLGVPQRRNRLIVLATRSPLPPAAEIWGRLGSCGHERTTKWALEHLQLDARAASLYDEPTFLSKKSRKRIEWLFKNDSYDLPNSLRPRCHHGDHSYLSMYGRLRWDSPAQTITSGYGSMGQGRFVHPKEMRTLTPHEAARLQTFPDFFRFQAANRGTLAQLIGNAVPPLGNTLIGDTLLTHGLRALALGTSSVAA